MNKIQGEFTPIIDHYRYDDPRSWISLSYYLKNEISLLKPKSDILIIGKGKGEHPLLLEHYGFSTYTLDINPENKPDRIHDLRTPFKTVLENIQGEPYLFDGVCCYHVLEHLPFKFVEPRLKDIFNTLKDGGVLFIALPVRSRPLILNVRFARWEKGYMKRFLKSFFTGGFHYWEVSKQHTPKQLKQLLLKVGFDKVTIQNNYLTPREIRFIATKKEVI